MSAAWKQITAAAVMPKMAAMYPQLKPASGVTYPKYSAIPTKLSKTKSATRTAPAITIGE